MSMLIVCCQWPSEAEVHTGHGAGSRSEPNRPRPNRRAVENFPQRDSAHWSFPTSARHLTSPTHHFSRPNKQHSQLRPTNDTMICRTCLRQAARLPSRTLPTARSFTTTLRPLNAAAAAPSPVADAPAAEAPADAVANQTKSLSSCPKGTILKGLNYFKDKSDPVALADDAYPAWLWDCLSVTKKAAAVDADSGADEFCTFPTLSSSSAILSCLH